MEGVRDEGRRIFAIGDIHGCLDKLRELMLRLPLESEGDRLVFVGDYINRGPDSRGVIDYLLDLAEHRPDTVFLMGNHEHALLDYSRSRDVEDLRLLRTMGVEATLRSYDHAPIDSLGELSFLPVEHRRFLESLRPFYRQEGYLFVHAGVAPGLDPGTMPLESLLTVRGPFLNAEPAGPDTVVFGHTAFDTPFIAPGRIGIDTGAVYGNLLTAVELPRLRFYHA